MSANIKPRTTRKIKVGTLTLGGDSPIAVQSMTATRTQDLQATARQIEILEKAGADIIRIAVDSKEDVEALKILRKGSKAIFSVDLQENYRLAPIVAPYVNKIRYNPGHLWHLDKDKTIKEKVEFIVNAAREHELAIRIGVNCGSVDPDYKARYPEDSIEAMVRSAVDHCAMMDELGFENYCVSLKDSDSSKVIEGNKRFSELRPDVPLHLGVTEAGMPPEGIIKTRIAFEQLIPAGIGDTIRVSLTVPDDDKGQEIDVGRSILDDIENGRFRSVPENFLEGLNIIACPSCSRVENGKFVDLAQDVRRMTEYAEKYKITIAVMGCRVNGPGETDDADLGLWCGPAHVNLKKKTETVGAFGYDEILGKLKEELDKLIEDRYGAKEPSIS
ncbi:4-hydroxy-3-methylbut-2-en-1-yl diphosphate synthase [Nitrospina gracilis 3/211]|uniref:4-hydroxy-3-methylbut-2-en-1-yl diphosphate synthase (flavodoxin) n=1 Tax=Nitrospina gracilis (strain 3/211) TaxID=1266370 RepID=M1Z076_NITG3|nr:(E)-4-hydroxy-3-methylbut-2-enyl-diphosphate synthase [Nitrospina gracilis]MCF8724245.1 (E)-4-hydroxy-3-methylbut-2-enyl-diphosphate synthase [Nitrospina sp. Nb-3]CCQ91393.1 4-hydroxy-3-methylbut-2-en-1-yl diphosphate synthase [Nitrospina gracilis 3/211]